MRIFLSGFFARAIVSLLLCCFTAGGLPLHGQEAGKTKKLYDFESPGPGDSPLVYRSRYSCCFGATYTEASAPSHFIGWDQRYFGYMKLDSTLGAKGTRGSLQLTVTGGNSDGTLTGKVQGCGGPVANWEDLQANPSRLCKDRTNQSFFVWFIHAWPAMNGRHSFPQATGANRMSFYIKLPTVFDQNVGGKVGQVGSTHYNLHVGTYTINPATQKSHPRNEDTHFYHWIAMNGGGWVHVLLDPHPQHERDDTRDPGFNPTQRRWNYNYFDGLSAFYIGDVNFTTRPTPWSVNIDEIEFYHTTDTAEGQQNDETMASMAVGYYPGDGHWEMNWYDSSQCEQCMATYEVRYSVEPITSANFDRATPVPVARYGPDKTGASRAGIVRKQSPWSSHVWTRFTLPAALRAKYRKIYFAVRDISEKGKHCSGENWENARCDPRDAPNRRLHTIDYVFAEEASGAVRP